jgi:hypothetical protein
MPRLAIDLVAFRTPEQSHNAPSYPHYFENNKCAYATLSIKANFTSRVGPFLNTDPRQMTRLDEERYVGRFRCSI